MMDQINEGVKRARDQRRVGRRFWSVSAVFLSCLVTLCTLQPIKVSAAEEIDNTGPQSKVKAGARAVKYYKSTMIAGEVSQNPGKDSMGMDMVPVYEGEDEAESSAIRIDPVTQQNMGIRTALVTTGPLKRQIRTVGTFDYNETALSDVTTRMPGWIEKLYADAMGKQVHAGEPLFDLFSPEFLSAQAEFLSSSNVPATGAMSRADLQKGNRMRLRVFGVPEEQIAALEADRQTRRVLRVNAPRSGVIIEKTAVEGMRTEGNERLYRIADLSTVWLMAQVYERDLPFVSLGQEAVAALSYYPDRSFRGRITFISPSLEAKTRTAMVRIEFHNPGYFLKPQMFANVVFESVLKPWAILVPDMAILRSGEKTTVFLTLDNGSFEPREVHVGHAGENGMVEVLHGLQPGERVVTSAQFLLDSESRLREAIQKMLRPASGGAEHAGHGVGSQDSSASTAPMTIESGAENSAGSAPFPTAYVCPMPEHASITYNAPGKCPICSMALVPVTSGQLPKLQETLPTLYYTCPMPEHADVRSAKPGKCPRCGMTLIPINQKPQEAPLSDRYDSIEVSTTGTATMPASASMQNAATTASMAATTSLQDSVTTTGIGPDPHTGHSR